MKVANIGEFKNRLSEFMNCVQVGEEIEVRKRNVPIARVVPIHAGKRNRTVLGRGLGTVEILAELTEPMISGADWKMLEGPGGGK